MTATEIERLCDQAWMLYLLIGSRKQVDRSARILRLHKKAGARYDRRAEYLAEYEQMLVQQGGECAICGQKDKSFNLAVDHCHGTKRIRGLLCSQCNVGLGSFKDKP